MKKERLTMPETKSEATTAGAYTGYGGFEKALHMLPGGVGIHMRWRKIDDLPTQGERDNCRKVIREDADAYKALGYRVSGPTFSDGDKDAEIYVYHRKAPTSSAVALLWGAGSSTVDRAGWGGGS
jgi:hypothetical protein